VKPADGASRRLRAQPSPEDQPVKKYPTLVTDDPPALTIDAMSKLFDEKLRPSALSRRR